MRGKNIGDMNMGSVKDLSVLKQATEDEMGIGVFDFSDRWSVFDYGDMGMPLPEKGSSLCRMAVHNFKELEKLGVKTHLRKFIEPNKMEVDLVRVLYPQKGEITKQSRNYLVPLEIVYRNELPEGSSVFRRLKKGEITIEDLGLDHEPVPGEKMDKPILELFTKLEDSDRYLRKPEAMEIAGLNEEELEKVFEIALKVNDYLNEKAESLGMVHADGKIELVLNPKREFVLADVCGTLDEDRFLKDGVHISKQVFRDYYIAEGTWFKQMEEVKAAHKPKEEWPAPSKVPDELLGIVENMYKSVAVEWTGEKTWDVPSVDEIVGQYRNFLKEMKAGD